MNEGQAIEMLRLLTEILEELRDINIALSPG